MADYARATISLSQGGGGGDLSPTSDDQNNDSDHSPRSLPPTTSSRHRKSLMLPLSSSSSPRSAATEPPKKPRGRPPGSKNKPKPPIVITKDSDSAMKPVVLEISAGSYVIESVVHFARRRRVGVTILSGSGTVSNVTLRHPMSQAPALSLHGPFTLLSLSGSVVGPSAAATNSSSPAETTSPSSSPSTTLSKPSFGICLAGAQGQVFGGIVGGKVVAASAVVVVATTFANASFHRLPGANTQDVDGHNHDHQETKPCVVGGNQEATAYTSTSPGTTATSAHVISPMPINCQLSSPDHVIPSWGHSSRSPY